MSIIESARKAVEKKTETVGSTPSSRGGAMSSSVGPMILGAEIAKDPVKYEVPLLEKRIKGLRKNDNEKTSDEKTQDFFASFFTSYDSNGKPTSNDGDEFEVNSALYKNQYSTAYPKYLTSLEGAEFDRIYNEHFNTKRPKDEDEAFIYDTKSAALKDEKMRRVKTPYDNAVSFLDQFTPDIGQDKGQNADNIVLGKNLADQLEVNVTSTDKPKRQREEDLDDNIVPLGDNPFDSFVEFLTDKDTKPEHTLDWNDEETPSELDELLRKESAPGADGIEYSRDDIYKNTFDFNKDVFATPEDKHYISTEERGKIINPEDVTDALGDLADRKDIVGAMPMDTFEDRFKTADQFDKTSGIYRDLYPQKYSYELEKLSDEELDELIENNGHLDVVEHEFTPNQDSTEKYLKEVKHLTPREVEYSRNVITAYNELPQREQAVLLSGASDTAKINRLISLGYDKETAERVVDYSSILVNEQEHQKMVKEIEDAGFLKLEGYNAAAFLTNLLSFVGQADLTYQAKRNLFSDTYRPVDYYTPLTAPGRFARETRKEKTERIDNEFLRNAYGLGTSMLDSALTMPLALLGPLGAGASRVIMSGSAGLNAVYDAKERGASDYAAVNSGIAASISEAMFESLSIGSFVDIFKKDAVESVLKKLVVQGFVEGSEETMTSLANAWADEIINGDKSEFNANVKKYIEAGKSEEEAHRLALDNYIASLGIDFVGGFISGGVFGSAGTAINNAIQKHDKKRYINDLNKITEKAGNLPGNEDLQLKPLTNNASEKEIESRKKEISDAIKTAENAVKTAETEASSAPLAERLDAMSAKNEAISVEDAKKATGFGDNGAKMVADLANTEGVTFSQAKSTVEVAYLAGFSNVDSSKVSFVTDTQIDAFTAGKLDRMMQDTTAKAEAANATVYNRGVVENDEFNKLSAADKKQHRQIAKDLGLRAEFVERILYNNNGKIVEANAQHQDGIYKRSSNSENAPYEDVIHEGLHRMKQVAPDETGVLINALVEHAEKFGRRIELGDTRSGTVFDEVKRKHDAANISLDTLDVLEEIGARELPNLFKSAKEWNAWRARLDANSKLQKAWYKFVDFIKELFDKLKRYVSQMNMTAEQKAKANKAIAERERRLSLYADAYTAAKNAVSEKTNAKNQDAKQTRSTEAEKSTEEDGSLTSEEITALDNTGIQYDSKSDSVAPSFSLKTWEKSEYVENRPTAITAIVKATGVSKKDAERYINNINSIAKYIADNKERLDYESNMDEFATVLKSNSEYKWTVDMSTLCAKRLLMTGTFDAIQRLMPNTAFDSNDIVHLREMMMERGYQVACGICYVESTRRELGPITAEFIKRYKEAQNSGKPITRINNKGEAVELKKTKEQMSTSKDKSTDKFFAEKGYTPTLADLNTTDIDLVKRDHPLVYEAYLNFMNARGQAKPKLLETRAEYKGEILGHFKNRTTVKSRNDAGGLRVQSFSDFEVAHLIDMMQIILDMSRVGLKSQAYTKVPAFAEVFGGTGMKINLSLIAKDYGLDESGNLVFDDIEGMDHKEAFRLRDKYSENVGTVLVGKNDAHIRAALADPRIDFVIPFHKSSWKESLYKSLGLEGYQDYTETQNEKPFDKSREITNFLPSEYWDYTKSGEENAKIYLEMCREDGRHPKFPEFQNEKGYWKLLIDFKMYNNDGVGSPQNVVSPDFDMDSAMKILTAYEGGHRVLPVANDVVEDFVKEYKQKDKISFSTKSPSQKIQDLNRDLENVKNGKASAEDALSKYVKDGTITTELYNELLESYGAIPEGENAHRAVKVPQRTAKDKKVSQTVRTILEAQATPDTAVPTIEKMVEDGVFSYDVYTDKQAISDAKEQIQKQGWTTTLGKFMADVENGIVSKQHTAIGWALYNNAANKAAEATSEDARREATQTALTILDAMVKHQRSAAQALQATRILKELSPETQLYNVQKSVSQLQQELIDKYGKKAPDLHIDEVLAEKFLKATSSDERLEIEIEIFRDIGRQMPSRFADKWNAWRYLAMLGNLRTHVRNFFGNAAFAPIVNIKNDVATIIELVGSAVSGGKMQRSKSFISSFVKSHREILEAAYADYANVADLVSNGGKYSDFAAANKYIEEGRTIFKNKALEGARKGNSKLLEYEDMWFSKPHYAYALARYCVANKITADQIKRGKAIAPARAYAIKEAQKATYRDTNAFSQFVSTIGRKGGKNIASKVVGYAVEGVLPFRKTPANILVRGIEYSPFGLLKSLSYDLVQAVKGKKMAYEVIDSFSAGLTGTGLLSLGIWAALEGLVRGFGEDEEKERKFMELMGHQAYALELPNGTSITLDWLAPEALPFFIGVNLGEVIKDSESEVNMSTILGVVSNISEPMLELSCLQGLNDVVEGVGYASSNDTSALVAIASSAATSYLTQGIPTLFGQIERTSEENRMTTYAEKNDFLTGDMQYTLGKISAKIPFWDYHQIPYIDAWGRKEASGVALKRGLNNFLNPAYTSTIEESNMEKELLRLHKVTNDGAVFPKRADKYFMVDGKRKDLTADEYVRYATLKGQKSYKAVTELVQSKAYKKLTDAEKVKAIAEAYDYANQKAKSAISKYNPEKWVEHADKFGSSIGNYLSFRADVNAAEKENDGKISKDMAIDIISKMAQSDDEIWNMYLSKYNNKGALYAHDNGIDGSTYLDFLEALNKVDEPNKSGEYDTYNQDEAEAAANTLKGLSDEVKAVLWQSVDTNWKNNPFR